MAATILDRIMATKREEIARDRSEVPMEQLKAIAQQMPSPLGFEDALAAPGPVKLIAEIKKASPSKGLIRADFDPVAIAKVYAESGATCISVLTDAPFFQGSLDYLRRVRNVVDLPLLRKDFILDTYQLWQARAAGADAVLLIAECLDDCHLRKLHNEAVDMGMSALVECYEPDNLPRVLDAGASLVGINNRDLRTFETDLQHTIRMKERIPANCVVVGESGIHGPDDLALLARAGVHAVLVGEHLMAQDDIAGAVKHLLSR